MAVSKEQNLTGSVKNYSAISGGSEKETRDLGAWTAILIRKAAQKRAGDGDRQATLSKIKSADGDGLSPTAISRILNGKFDRFSTAWIQQHKDVLNAIGEELGNYEADLAGGKFYELLLQAVKKQKPNKAKGDSSSSDGDSSVVAKRRSARSIQNYQKIRDMLQTLDLPGALRVSELDDLANWMVLGLEMHNARVTQPRDTDQVPWRVRQLLFGPIQTAFVKFHSLFAPLNTKNVSSSDATSTETSVDEKRQKTLPPKMEESPDPAGSGKIVSSLVEASPDDSVEPKKCKEVPSKAEGSTTSGGQSARTDTDLTSEFNRRLFADSADEQCPKDLEQFNAQWLYPKWLRFGRPRTGDEIQKIKKSFEVLVGHFKEHSALPKPGSLDPSHLNLLESVQFFDAFESSTQVKWYLQFFSENLEKPSLLIRFLEELWKRGLSCSRFFHLYAVNPHNNDNIAGNLAYCDLVEINRQLPKTEDPKRVALLQKLRNHLARDYHQSLLQKQPGSVSTRMAEITAKPVADREPFLKQLVNELDAYADAHIELAWHYFWTDRFVDALDAVKCALDRPAQRSNVITKAPYQEPWLLNADDSASKALAMSIMASAHRRLKNYDLALNAAYEAIGHDPFCVDAHRTLVGVYSDCSEPYQASQIARHAWMMYMPESALLLSDLLVCLVRSGQLDDAAKFAELAKLVCSDSGTLYNACCALTRNALKNVAGGVTSESFDDAIDCLKKSAEFGAHDPKWIETLGDYINHDSDFALLRKPEILANVITTNDRAVLQQVLGKFRSAINAVASADVKKQNPPVN